MKYTTFYFYFSNTLIFVQSIGIRWVSLIPAWICLWIRKEISHHYNVLLKLVKSDYNFHLYFFHFTKHDYFNSLGQLHFSICSRTQNCTWAWKSCFLYQFSTLSVFSAYMPPRLKKSLKSSCVEYTIILCEYSLKICMGILMFHLCFCLSRQVKIWLMIPPSRSTSHLWFPLSF